MESRYICYSFNVSPIEPGVEILIAELGELPFESFEETENGVNAYVQEAYVYENMLDEVYVLTSEEFEISYTTEAIEQVNWNEEWEKNFDAIDVDGICYVRAPFHEPKEVKYEIVIEPKMSFGTGHHETTYLMMKHILELDVTDKNVLDMGCGTALLAILAMMKGAKHSDAIDIDNWCYLNSIENGERNNIKNMDVFEGDASLLVEPNKYDVVIANINRNILLNDMSAYANVLKSGGTILFSGFYVEDIPAIRNSAESFGMEYINHMEKNNWVALKFIKK